MKKIQTMIRWILSILLLWQVWTHSHWSVALSLTLITITIESVTLILARLNKRGLKGENESNGLAKEAMR